MFFELPVLLTFVAASVAVIIVPGPSVTVIIANSLKFGTRAGLSNILGTQAGMAVLLILLALGLGAITTTLAWLFDWLRLLGAGYLIWLGYKFLRSDGTLGEIDEDNRNPQPSFFWQGFVVVVSNPKVLLFYGAFLPQFIDPAGNTVAQTLLLGAIFMTVATILDSGYAFAAGRAGKALTRHRVRAAEVGAGSLMIGGGLWLALNRN